MKAKISKLGIVQIISALLIAATLALTVTTYAISRWTVDESYTAVAGTNYFTLGGEYYASYSLTDGQTQLNVAVDNHIVNSGIINGYYDLIILADDGVNVSIAGKTASRIARKAGGYTYVFSHIAHSTPSSDGTMNLPVTLSGVSGGIIKAAVVDYSEHNEYVSDFFSLRLLNNEKLHNAYYSDAFADWTSCGSGTFVTSGDAVTIGGMGTVYTDETNFSQELTGTVMSDGRLRFRFNRFVVNGLTVAGGYYFDFYSYADGNYYNGEYGLKLVVNGGNVTLYNMPYKAETEYANVYFTDDVTVEEDFELNVPSKLNLLFSTLTLNADMRIAHFYGGNYLFSAIERVGNAVINDNHTLTIATPNAYMTTAEAKGGVENMISSPNNFIKESEHVDFDADAEKLTSLISDATAYINEYLPQRTYTNCIMPSNYHNYKVRYEYTTDNAALSPLGTVERSSSDVTVNVTVKVYYKEELKATAQKAVVVVGESEASLVGYLSYQTDNYLTQVEALIGGQNYLIKSADIFRIIADVGREIGLTTLRLTTDGTLTFSLSTGGVATEWTAAIFDFVNKTVTFSKEGVDDSVIANSDVTTINLTVPKIVHETMAEHLNFGYGYSNGNFTKELSLLINLYGLTYEEKTAYIERYVETLYITKKGVVFDVLRLGGDGIYSGTTAADNKIIPSTLGASAINYKVYIVSMTDYESYKAGSITLSQLLTAVGVTDKTDSFVFSDGTVTAQTVKVPTGKTLIMTTAVTIGSDVYTAVRPVITPADGIGGDDYTQYTKGDTYREYFDKLIDGKLIDSTADEGTTSGSAYQFMSFDSGVTLYMSIINAEDVINNSLVFCRLVKSANGYYQIDINVDNIPAKNTTVKLYVKFSVTINETEATLNEQEYSFVIPGIYKEGRDVADSAIYKRMLQVYDNYNDKYLLVDGAQSYKATFDCSLSTLVGVASQDVISLDGVQLLTSTASMKFDGIKIASLEPFGNFSTHELTKLSLVGCGINDALLTAVKADGRAHLYYLNTLTEIALDGNAIGSLVDNNGNTILYRTVERLSLSAQTDGNIRTLSVLNGISSIVNLTYLDLHGNAVADFNELKNCSKLFEVNVADNVCSDFGNKTGGDALTYYGRYGEVNKSVFVSLVDKGVTVKGDGDTLYSEGERISALALNAVSVFSTQYGGVTLPEKIYVSSNPTGAYYAVELKYLIINGAAAEYTSSAVDGDNTKYVLNGVTEGKVKAIIAVTVNGSTAFRQIEFVLKAVSV